MWRNRSAASASTPAKASNDSHRWRSAKPTADRKRFVVHVKKTLNGWKSFDSWSPGFSISEQSAGVSVSAVKPESTTATASVTANCL